MSAYRDNNERNRDLEAETTEESKRAQKILLGSIAIALAVELVLYWLATR